MSHPPPLPDAVQSIATDWYFHKDGASVRATYDELVAAIETQRIRADSLIWHETLSGWTPLAETQFSKYLAISASSPPQSLIADIDNTESQSRPKSEKHLTTAELWAWAYTLIPVLNRLLAVIFPGAYSEAELPPIWQPILMIAVFNSFEQTLTKKAGYKPPSMFLALFLPPVYLYKRSVRLQTDHAMTLTWCVSVFALFIFR